MKKQNKLPLAILGTCMGITITTISFSIITANLASIEKALNASPLSLQWIVNIFGITLTSTVITMGRLGDIIGRKKLYLIGLSLFTLAMIGAGLAQHVGIIIFFQAVAGVATAICSSMSQALVSHLFPEEKRGRAIGIWAAFGGFALALGPILGGIVIDLISWRGIFFAIIPFALIGMILTGWLVEESKTKGVSKEMDWKGVGFLFLGISSLTLALIQALTWPWFITFGLFLVLALSIIGLIYVEKRAKMPIIREDLFQNKMFLLASAGNFCMLGFAWAGFFLIPLFFQSILAYSALEAGILLLLYSIPIGLFSPLSGGLFEKFGPKQLMLFGFLCLILSLVIQFFFSKTSSLFEIGSATAFFGIGVACIWSPSTTAAISTISRNFAGIASGSFITIQEIGGNTGVALAISATRLSSDFSQGYRYGVAVLLVLCVLGLIVTSLMPKHRKKVT